MQPRRPVFGEAYIGDTVSAFSKYAASKQARQNIRLWAEDVLRNYFEVVEDTPVISRARAAFGSYEGGLVPTRIPYKSRDRVRTIIEPEELENLFKQRRATRWYKDLPVDSGLLNRAIQMASYAPSACNRQPYKFHVVNGPPQAGEVAGLAMGTKGFEHNIQCIVAVVGDLSAYPYERDRHLIYIDSALASMQFMLALECMGLSSCPLNWPDIEFREKAIAEKLSLPSHERVIMLISVGIADEEGLIPYSAKKPASSLSRNV